MDEIAGKLDEKVIMQIGAGDHEPRNSMYFRNAPYPEIKALIEEARVVICHAGSGSVLDCVSSGKLPIVVPRLARFGEARDDHQLELAKFLVKDGSAIVVTEIDQLSAAINLFERERTILKEKSRGRKRGILPNVLKEFINGLSE